MTAFQFAHVLPSLSPGSVIPEDDVERLRESLRRLVGARAADRILEKTGTVGVARMPSEELAAVAEIQSRLADRIVAARDFGLALAHPPAIAVGSSADVLRVLPPGFATLETEVLLAFVLTASLTVKATVFLAKGSDVRVDLNVRAVFVPLVRLAAAAFILVHNHPAGTTTPSAEDIRFTRRVEEAGTVIGIPLVDHVIVTPRSAVSLRDLGVLGSPVFMVA